MKVNIRLALTMALLLALAMAASAATIPAGTKVSVRINRELDSGKDRAGDPFDGVLQNAIVVNGKTVAARGATVRGRVTSAKDSGRIHKPGYISIRLTEINGIPVNTSAVGRQGKSHTKSNVTKIGGGAAAGALIGALAGGGKGAAIGAGVGAGAGTGVAYATGKQQAVFPAESLVSFTVTSSGAAARR
ncbi:MAG: hypothetical protein HYX28_04400 [Candidatus Koribacter versatilis]|uniref:Glycine zipper domain-containing protein n=1 Tax=Candidatus Korobacter versatilis TaxID=658062 RepID=A0A932EPS0_9BACT|nr:hypothetical protein [Candidatus Koribacter versatilis]